jgi:hypothetical protein
MHSKLGLFLVLTEVISSYQVTVRQPVITSEPDIFRAPVSDEVTLPCAPEHLGTFVLVWKHRDEVLTAGSMMVTPDTRYGLVGGYNLRIKNINMKNAGAYTCSISTFGDPVTVTHTLEILVSPLVTAEPSDGNYVVKKGKRVELKCKSSGNPPPEIHWAREDGGVLPMGQRTLHSKQLLISRVSREDEGVYTCTATNGVGSPATASIALQVLYPPEIELETDRVHSGINKEAHLTCRVQGNPAPEVTWYRDSNLLSKTDTTSFQSEENRHTLILSIRSGTDFGNYSCVASNSLGTFKKHIEVHGRPTAAVFRSKPNTHQHESYQLSWSVDSYTPIEEYRLLYRKIKPYHGPIDSSFPLGEGDWTNVIIPGDLSSPGFTHLRSYLISGLLPESEYECLVQARNRFGWSDASRLFTFFTSTNIPVAHDLEWRAAFSGASLNTCYTTTSIAIIVLHSYFRK